MTTKSQQGIALAVVSAILFFAGTGLCLLNHWKPEADFLSLPNLLAIAMAAFLTTAEFSFLWCDIRLIQAKRTIKRIALACCLVALILSMSWAIGSEWESAEGKVKAALGMGAVAEVSKVAIAAGKSRGERAAATKEALATVGTITNGMMGSSTRAYQVNFMIALLAIVVAHFCVEKPKRRSLGQGNVAATNPKVKEKLQQMGFSPGSAKAYNVPGGVAIHDKEGYKGFIPNKEL